MLKKLKDYFPIGTIGLFGTFNNPLWIKAFPDSDELDLYFTMRYGEKTAAEFMNAFLDDSGALTVEGRQRLAKVIYSINFKKWEHLFKIYNAEYNPLENTDFVETIKDINSNIKTVDTDNIDNFSSSSVNASSGSSEGSTSGSTLISSTGSTETSSTGSTETSSTGSTETSSTGSTDASSTGNNSISNSKYGFDSVAAVGDTESSGSNSDTSTSSLENESSTSANSSDSTSTNSSDSTSTTASDSTSSTSSNTNSTTNASTSSEDSTITDNGTHDSEHRKHGNIGVTSTVTLMTEEKDFWKWSFIDAVCLDICEIIALSIYNY